MSPPFLPENSDTMPDLAESLNSLDLKEKEQWNLQNEVVANEVQDIMVDVLVIFLSLPVMLESPAVIDKWNSAFETLFESVRGLRPIFTLQKRLDLSFEGRPGRFYLRIELEYFLASFFPEFYEILTGAGNLGDLQAGDAYSDPLDDLVAVYEYVRKLKNRSSAGGKIRERRSSTKEYTPGVSRFESGELLLEDIATSTAAVSAYLNNLVDVGSDSSHSGNLMEIARSIDTEEDSSLYRFFQLFRRQEFAKFYGPVRHSVNGLIMVEVLTRYYKEFMAQTRGFNAPTFETIVKDMKRDKKCDSDWKVIGE